jgi:hypothetical protein
MFAMYRLVAAGLVALSLTAPVQGASLESLSTSRSATLPVDRPEFPIPTEPNQLFYLQRSTNANTVVYTARFDGNGNLDARDPVGVYWRRYNTTGARKALSLIEQLFAFGVNVSASDTPGQFILTPKPLRNRRLLLRQTGPGKAEVLTQIGGRTARLVYLYFTVDENRLIPMVTGLSAHGIDLATGHAISETFAVTGGALRP